MNVYVIHILVSWVVTPCSDVVRYPTTSQLESSAPRKPQISHCVTDMSNKSLLQVYFLVTCTK
jgi:hypothetical protein